MDTIILQDITLQPKLADLSEDARFVAQLLMDDLVFEETEVVGKGPTDPFWNLRGTFLVPANADYFTISIFKVSGSEERSHLVAIEISSAQIVENSGDHKISVRIQLTKLDEEPIADLGFSVGLSTSNYAARSSPDNVIQVVRSLDREGIILLLTQVTLSDSSCINADLGLLNAMYGVVFRLPNERIDKSRALCLLANIHVARYDTYLTIAGDDAINHPMYEIYSIGLKSSLHMLEDAVHLAADDHPKKSWLLISFSMCLQRSMLQQVNHSEKFGVLALKLLEVAPLLPDEEPKKPILLNYIGVALGHRFTQYNDLLDLNNSIAVLEDAVRLTPDDDIAYKASFLNDLSDSLSRRFEKLHVPRDKSRSLLLRETALRLMPDGDPQKPVLLNFLGHAFFLRSEEFSDLDLTNRSIQSYETALLLIGDDHSEKSSILNNLSSSLQLRFKQLDVFANPEDLRRIQQGLEDAVHLSAEGDPNKLSYTINLGKFFLFHFGKLADIVSVERCVSILEDATHLAATADIDKVLLLNDFGQSLFIHSDELTKLNHINEVLILCEAAARLIPDDQPNKLGVLDRLGAALSRRFDQERERSHIDKTIVIYEDAVRLTADNNLQKPIRLNHLGEAYLKRFEHFNELDDVDKSISLSQEALELTLTHEEIHPARPSVLSNLGHSVFQRFQRLRDVGDIDKSIMFYADAVQLTSKDDSQKAIRLNDLGFAHLVRFEHVGDLGDLDISISALKSAVHETRWIDSTRKPEVMDNLCRTLFSRFNRRGDLTDFDEAISTLQNGGYLTLLSSKEEPSPHDAFKYYVEHFNRFEDAMDFAKLALAVKDTADRLFSDNISQDNVRLHNLGLLLEARLMKMDDLGEITESGLAMLEDAAKRLPDTYPKKPTWLHTVAKLLSKHFDRFKINGDLTRAIVMYEDAVRLTSDGHSPYLDVSTSLGFSLLTRFRWLGNLDDLNRSVNALEDAVQLFPDHGQDPDRYLLLNNLGASLLDRFALLRDIGDFNRSAKMFLDAQRSAPPNHTVDAALNIATLLMNRTELVGSLDDINEAIAIYDKNTPDVGHNISNQASDLSYHAMALLHRFRILGDLEDVEKAIQLLDQALKCFQENDYTKAYILKDYAIAFAQRFVRLRNVDDISKCITSLRQAVELTPDFHPFKVDLLFELGRWLPGRFEILRDTQDLEDACSCLSAAASSRTGSIRWKFRAASFWAHCARYFRHGNPMAAYALSMELLPRLAWLGLSIPLRHQQLFEAGEVVVDAVAAAIEQSQYDIAIEWLEQGRSVIWAQLIELRTPAGDLARAHPKLATNLQRLSERLEATSSPTTNPERYHDVAHERDQLIESIRSLEGFGNFLRPKKLEQLLPSARGGPIVTINVSQYRCDVLVLMPNCDEVVHIPLEQFSAADASGLLESLRDVLRRRGALRGSQRARKSPFSKRPKVNPEIVFENILSKLWLCVAKPVLDGVGIKVPSTENMPRIWWCLTGSLAFLPIHAAGLYAPGISSGSKLSDFVVSSYLPSISSLITTGRPRNISKRQVLTVALPIESELPCVQEEIDAIEIAVSDFPVLRLMESDATVENVIAGMKASNFVHFACHGVQNTSVSTESALLLAENAKLSISDIAKLNLPHAELAFLSACQTATGDELLAEESVHLAAGMLSAGFQGVIGTMWSISDNDAPLVAKAVYSHLFRGKAAPDTTEAAHALHVAVKRLQEESPAKKSFLSWVPFIHIGA